MKKGYAVSVGVIALALMLFGTISADAQWRSKTHDVYEALTGVNIKVDGDVADWDGVLEAVTGTDGKPFTGVELEINKPFQEHDGGKWAGADDHETSVMMVWEPATFYIGLIVTDDTHENAANSGWNGDAFQLAFEMSGKRKPGFRYCSITSPSVAMATSSSIMRRQVAPVRLMMTWKLSVMRAQRRHTTKSDLRPKNWESKVENSPRIRNLAWGFA